METLILGAGSFALEVMDLCTELGIGIRACVVNVDGQPSKLNGVSVFHVQDLEPGEGWYVMGTIWPERAILARSVEEKGYRPMTLVHPWTSVSRQAELHPGCLIGQGATVARGTKVEKGAIVNRGAIIGHDCILEEFSTVSPGANLTAFVTVGQGAMVYMGANIREHITIGKGAIVGMGSVVLENVPAGETWWGVPARKQ